MTTTINKNAMPVHEEVVVSFNQRISAIVRKARDSVAEHRNKGQKSGEIDNLMKCALFNFINWELTAKECEGVGVSGYESTVENPIIHELPNEEYSRICDEVADSFIQGISRTKPLPR